MATEVKVPTLGESITEATLGEWLKKPGDPVKADEPIASLETDKVAVEVNAPVAGVLAEHVASEGDTVSVGAVIARIKEGASAATAATPAVEDRTAVGKAEAAAPAEPAAAPVGQATPPGYGNHGEAEEGGTGGQTLSPSVRRAVLEHGVDHSKIKGTGKDGRLTKDDVIEAAKTQPAAAKAAAPAPSVSAPAVSSGAGRKEERVRMSRLRQTVAKRL